MNDGKNITIHNIKERSYLFDNIKAILIFSVVAAHYFRASDSFALPTFGGVIYMTSFAYIMQGFIFISGFFSRNLEKCRTTAFQTFLFPYLVLMPIMFCIRYFLFGRANFDLTLPTMALWYLLTLFLYRYFLKDLVKINRILLISIAVSLAAGLIPIFDATLSLGRTFGFLPFFLFGYYFKPQWIEKLRKIPKEVSCTLLSSLFIFSVFIAYSGLIPVEALFYKASYGSTGLTNFEGIGVRVILSLVSLAWIFVFITLTTQKRTFLTELGQNTMAIYVLHIVIRYLVKSTGDFFGHDIPSSILLILIAGFSVWLFSRTRIVNIYHYFMDTLYQWAISIPLAFIRQIL
ncbi:MAG: acyltransferase family protein [Dehalobacterium sp.]